MLSSEKHLMWTQVRKMVGLTIAQCTDVAQNKRFYSVTLKKSIALLRVSDLADDLTYDDVFHGGSHFTHMVWTCPVSNADFE